MFIKMNDNTFIYKKKKKKKMKCSLNRMESFWKHAVNLCGECGHDC